MFGKLFGKKPAAARVEDQVWITDAARRAGMHAAIVARLTGGRAVMLICTDNSAFDAWAETLAAHEPLHCRDIFGRNTLQSRLSQPGALVIALSGSVPVEAATATQSVSILVYGRQATRAADDALVRFADKLGTSASIEFHLSIDDALLAPFADRYSELLRQLGANENEAISNSMLSKAIANAQSKSK